MVKRKMVKLCDMFTLQMGKTPSRDNSAYWNGTHKWVSIADLGKATKIIVDTKECITDLAVSETGIKATPKDTVVMSFKLSIGKTAVTAEEIYTNEAIMSFIDKGIYDFDIDYIYHLFSGKDWSEGTNKAVMGVTLNKATLSQIIIPLPPIEEQQKIAHNLGKVTYLIEVCNAILEKLDLLVKSRFVEMFGDCRTNPKGWNTIELGNIAYVGSSKRVFVEELIDSGIPFYRGTEVGALAEGKMITPELFISQEHYEELIEATGKPIKGDLLMPSICPDGRIWVVDTDKQFYFKDGRVLWVHNINKQFDSIFLLYTLKDRIITDYQSIASGTTFAELKIFALKQCKVFEVPIEIQRIFSSFVEQTDKSKLAVKRVLEKAETLKKALMQKYFG